MVFLTCSPERHGPWRLFPDTEIEEDDVFMQRLRDNDVSVTLVGFSEGQQPFELVAHHHHADSTSDAECIDYERCGSILTGIPKAFQPSVSTLFRSAAGLPTWENGPAHKCSECGSKAKGQHGDLGSTWEGLFYCNACWDSWSKWNDLHTWPNGSLLTRPQMNKLNTQLVLRRELERAEWARRGVGPSSLHQ